MKRLFYLKKEDESIYEKNYIAQIISDMEWSDWVRLGRSFIYQGFKQLRAHGFKNIGE